MNRLGLDKIIAATDAAFLLVTSIGTLLTTVPQDETFLRSAYDPVIGSESLFAVAFFGKSPIRGLFQPTTQESESLPLQ